MARAIIPDPRNPMLAMIGSNATRNVEVQLLADCLEIDNAFEIIVQKNNGFIRSMSHRLGGMRDDACI